MDHLYKRFDITFGARLNPNQIENIIQVLQ